MIKKDAPSLLVVDDLNSTEDALTICNKAKELGIQAPIVVIADQEDTSGMADFKTETILRPFSIEYARTRLRAWVLRTTCRWVRAQNCGSAWTRIMRLHGSTPP